MVYFVCSQCQETLKLRALDTHRCRHHTLSCVDCSRDFSPAEAREHNKCISEAEKYEKSLFKGKAKGNKVDPQQEWTDAACRAAATASTAAGMQVLLSRIADYPNVPRKLPKFLNFAKSSLGVRDEKLLTAAFRLIEAAMPPKPVRPVRVSAAAASAGSKRPRAASSDTDSDDDDDDDVPLAAPQPAATVATTGPGSLAGVKVKTVVRAVLTAAGERGLPRAALLHAATELLLLHAPSRFADEDRAQRTIEKRLISMGKRGRVIDATAPGEHVTLASRAADS